MNLEPNRVLLPLPPAKPDTVQQARALVDLMRVTLHEQAWRKLAPADPIPWEAGRCVCDGCEWWLHSGVRIQEMLLADPTLIPQVAQQLFQPHAHALPPIDPADTVH